MRSLPTVIVICLITASCCFLGCNSEGGSGSGASASSLQTAIDKAEKDLYGDSKQLTFDKSKAVAVIDSYNKYAAANPKDGKTPEYLFKAAEIHRSIRDHKNAITTYERIIKDYPDYEKVPHSLFLIGFTYENDLKNTTKAKELYAQFLEKYPKHELYESVKFSFDNLGTPPEEIIKRFEEQKSKNDGKIGKQKPNLTTDSKGKVVRKADMVKGAAK